MALAEYRQAAGDLSGARSEYEQLLALYPGNAVVLNNLAWLYAEQGDPRAEDFARRAYEAAPKEWAIADTYGWVLVRSGKAEQGVVILQQAADESKNNPEVLYHLGAALAKTGAKAPARDALERALRGAGTAPWKADAEATLVALQ
jgi:Flp pilus assembly protein TadD